MSCRCRVGRFVLVMFEVNKFLQRMSDVRQVVLGFFLHFYLHFPKKKSPFQGLCNGDLNNAYNTNTARKKRLPTRKNVGFFSRGSLFLCVQCTQKKRLPRVAKSSDTLLTLPKLIASYFTVTLLTNSNSLRYSYR